MDDSKVALLGAFKDVRDRFNRLRADHRRLQKLTKGCQNCRERGFKSSAAGSCASHCSSQTCMPMPSTSSSMCSSIPDASHKNVNVSSGEVEVEIADICRRLERLAAVHSGISAPLVTITNDLLKVTEQAMHTENDGICQQEHIPVDNDSKHLTGCNNVGYSADAVGDSSNGEQTKLDSIKTEQCVGKQSGNDTDRVQPETRLDGDGDDIILEDSLSETLTEIADVEKMAAAQFEELNALTIFLRKQQQALQDLLEQKTKCKSSAICVEAADHESRSMCNDESWAIVNLST